MTPKRSTQAREETIAIPIIVDRSKAYQIDMGAEKIPISLGKQ